VNCNSFVKWDALWQRARAVGADAIATGHYAATLEQAGKTFIRRGEDPAKDQSYFLWGVPPNTLAQTLFPLGGMAKPAVRALAREAGLRTADKRESQDICFVPKGDYRTVVAERAQREGRAILPGPILNPDGKVVGEHKGLAFYTIGQRRGVEIAAGEPVYVKRLNTATNTLELGRKSDLECRAFWADRHNDFEGDWETRLCEVQYRYRSKPVPGKLTRQENQRVLVELESPGLGVCPGQSAVFYEGDRLLGGARIRETL
jgi:tRNA-specific 2-thiouridylase